MTPDKYKAVSARIDSDWYPYHEGEWFTQVDICRHFSWIEPETKQAVSKKLYHDSHERKPLFLEKNNKAYRVIEKDLDVLDWQSADPNNVVPLELPFDIHNFCRIYPKSIIVVAGEKNEGKTAFLYKTIQLNMGKFIIDLYNSETGPEQMKERMSPLGIPEPAPFTAYSRASHFADVIHPEHLSLIDYLEIDEDYFLVGKETNAIFRKLTTGVCIIGEQKPPSSVTYVKGVKKIIDRDFAYGGMPSAWKSALYIVLSNHRLKLKYVKTPPKKSVNPNNMTWRYDFSEDGYFTNIERYFGEGMEF